MKDTAPTEVGGCTMDGGQEAMLEILDRFEVYGSPKRKFPLRWKGTEKAMNVCARIALLALVTPLLFGQTAQITGRVADSTEAVVPAVKIRVTNVNTGIARDTQTNSEGYYSVPLLPPGEYRMLVRAEGFKPSTRDGITLAVAQIARIDFVLELGALTESVTVAAGAPLVDASSATIGKVVENRRIVELPLNGRNALALVLLTPGVKSNAGPTNSGFGDRGITLSSVSINGSPSGMNSYLLDGGNNNDGYQAGLNINPSVDAVEEFKVQSNTMSAEYGFTAGGVVNIIRVWLFQVDG